MQVVDDELVQAKLLRKIYSERQLQEVMTDFWLNHFNVFIGKEADRYLLTSYERDVFVRTRWANSRTCWSRLRRVQPCCFILTTG